MRLIFVRHGEPNYAKDCITENGKLQAAAGAVRLERENIDEIYASPFGRAYQTAEYTSEKTGLPINILDYMHEISWGGPGLPENGHPWILSDRMINEDNFNFSSENWMEHPYFKENAATEYFKNVSAEFDGFLEKQGYRHEGRRFLCLEENDKNIAIFSHGGSAGIVLSSLLNIPMPIVFSTMPFEFVSVIILNFPSVKGEYVHPRLELFNDTAHTKGISNGLVLQKEC